MCLCKTSASAQGTRHTLLYLQKIECYLLRIQKHWLCSCMSPADIPPFPHTRWNSLAWPRPWLLPSLPPWSGISFFPMKCQCCVFVRRRGTSSTGRPSYALRCHHCPLPVFHISLTPMKSHLIFHWPIWNADFFLNISFHCMKYHCAFFMRLRVDISSGLVKCRLGPPFRCSFFWHLQDSS